MFAPETAAHASGTAALLPMLALGIPGSGTAAILLGGLMVWGLNPGPLLFVEHKDFVWGLIASMYLGNVVGLVLVLTTVPIFASILRVPFAAIAPMIAFAATGPVQHGEAGDRALQVCLVHAAGARPGQFARAAQAAALHQVAQREGACDGCRVDLGAGGWFGGDANRWRWRGSRAAGRPGERGSDRRQQAQAGCDMAADRGRWPHGVARRLQRSTPSLRRRQYSAGAASSGWRRWKAVGSMRKPLWRSTFHAT